MNRPFTADLRRADERRLSAFQNPSRGLSIHSTRPVIASGSWVFGLALGRAPPVRTPRAVSVRDVRARRPLLRRARGRLGRRRARSLRGARLVRIAVVRARRGGTRRCPAHLGPSPQGRRSPRRARRLDALPRRGRGRRRGGGPRRGRGRVLRRLRRLGVSAREGAGSVSARSGSARRRRTRRCRTRGITSWTPTEATSRAWRRSRRRSTASSRTSSRAARRPAASAARAGRNRARTTSRRSSSASRRGSPSPTTRPSPGEPPSTPSWRGGRRAELQLRAGVPDGHLVRPHGLLPQREARGDKAMLGKAFINAFVALCLGWLVGSVFPVYIPIFPQEWSRSSSSVSSPSSASSSSPPSSSDATWPARRRREGWASGERYRTGGEGRAGEERGRLFSFSSQNNRGSGWMRTHAKSAARPPGGSSSRSSIRLDPVFFAIEGGDRSGAGSVSISPLDRSRSLF